MRHFKVNVNGQSYDVDVEEIGGGQGGGSVQPLPTGTKPSVPTRPSRPKAASVPKPTPVKAAPVTPKPEVKQEQPKAAQPSGGGASVTAPMPGVILDIKVSPGDQVNEGDTLLILEAMKMENEISAASAGKVTDIPVKKGDSVNAGDVLIVIE